MDPSAVQKRKGGRRPVEQYLLRGLAFCGHCGEAMYTRRQAAGRMCVCRNRREATGLCNAPPIPAEDAERGVLQHLDLLGDTVRVWLRRQADHYANERSALERAALAEEKRHVDLVALHAKALSAWQQLLAEGRSVAAQALEGAEGIARQRDEQAHAVATARARVQEFESPPDLDAALDFYNELLALIEAGGSRTPAVSANWPHRSVACSLACGSASTKTADSAHSWRCRALRRAHRSLSTPSPRLGGSRP
jgi:hypothetical protein